MNKPIGMVGIEYLERKMIDEIACAMRFTFLDKETNKVLEKEQIFKGPTQQHVELAIKYYYGKWGMLSGQSIEIKEQDSESDTQIQK